MVAGAICMIKPSTSIMPQFGEGALGKWDEERNFHCYWCGPLYVFVFKFMYQIGLLFFPELFRHPAVKAKWVMCSDSVPRFSLFQFVIVSHFSYSYTLDHIWWKIIVLNLCWGITFFITSQLKKTMVHWKNCTRREIFKYLSKKICFYKYYMKDYS